MAVIRKKDKKLGMSSHEMKTKVLAYLRFKRRYLLCATEAGPYDADVLACNDKEVVEVEIKRSKSDLKNDLKKKKHRFYLAEKTKAQVPNRFFFAVPAKLVDAAIELCKNTPYGVLEIESGTLDIRSRYCFVKVHVKAKPLNNGRCTKLRKRLLKRCSSELIRLRMVVHGL